MRVPQESNFIRSLPKAELHLHLEGAVEPETLAELSRRHPTPFVSRNPRYVPAADSGRELTPEAARALFQVAGFGHFLRVFKAVSERLRTAEDFELITYRLLERLQAENIRHAEVYVSVGVYLRRGDNFDSFFQGMERGRRRGEREFGVSLLWLFDAVRQFGPEEALRVAEKAVQWRAHNVAGFGLGGDERSAAPEMFRDAYACARGQGLHVTAHAGETVGPESIAKAVEVLGAERIGHALSAREDAALLARLVERQIPLEICLTSNLRTASGMDLARHPLREYFQAGALVTLNTDDPAIFGTTLNREFQLAQEVLGFSDFELGLLAANSFRASFLDERQKQSYLQLFNTATPR
jgi:adenosine deaminase/aminodeoxyfutalosine deaminase